MSELVKRAIPLHILVKRNQNNTFMKSIYRKTGLSQVSTQNGIRSLHDKQNKKRQVLIKKCASSKRIYILMIKVYKIYT